MHLQACQGLVWSSAEVSGCPRAIALSTGRNGKETLPPSAPRSPRDEGEVEGAASGPLGRLFPTQKVLGLPVQRHSPWLHPSPWAVQGSAGTVRQALRLHSTFLGGPPPDSKLPSILLPAQTHDPHCPSPLTRPPGRQVCPCVDEVWGEGTAGRATFCCLPPHPPLRPGHPLRSG